MYEYRNDADGSTSFKATKLSGLPKDIKLGFDTIHLRIFKSREQLGYFSCSLAVPALKDDEGYVLEMDFSDTIKSSRDELSEERLGFDDDYSFGDSLFQLYEAPFHDQSVSKMLKSVTLEFQDKTEMGQRLVTINATIPGTPFRGYVLFDKSHYQESA